MSPAVGLRLVQVERARRSLHEFVRQAWSIVEPAKPLIDNWHIGAICDHLQAVSRGDIRRLLINIGPGHAKSLLVAVLWPAWMWTHRPDWRGLFVSHSEKLSFRDSMKCRTLVESDWYREAFSKPAGWVLSDDQNAKGLFTNTRSGLRMALGITGGNTGFRGNAVVMDDPIAAGDAFSKPARDEVIRRWDFELSNRLNVPERDALVLIMQRLHDEDLSGHLLAQGGYQHLCLPTEFEPERRSVTFVDVAADERREFWRDPRQADGELLFPALYTQQVIDDEKRRGSIYFAGQHQQRPTPAGGELFKVAWWRFWRPKDSTTERAQRPGGCSDAPARVLPELDRIILSVDAAFKSTDSSDYVVFQVWGAADADRFLLAQVRGRMSFSETLATFRRLDREWPDAHKKLVEDKANGSAVIDTLRSEISGIIAVQPEGGKEARAAAAQPQVESGNVYLPDGAEWLDTFIDEFATFPRGRHDDQVDALTQALLDLGQGKLTTAERWRRAQLEDLEEFARVLADGW